MRYLAASALMIVSLAACPSDDEGGDTGADTGTDPTTTPSTTMDTSSGSGSGSGSETTAPEESGSSSGGGEPGPPVINGVMWTQAEGCMMNTGSDVVVVVDVEDPDNDVSELTFSGTILGCTGEITGPETTILCPQVAPYTGTIEVEDPDGNTDDIEITIEVCMDGSEMP